MILKVLILIAAIIVAALACYLLAYLLTRKGFIKSDGKSFSFPIIILAIIFSIPTFYCLFQLPIPASSYGEDSMGWLGIGMLFLNLLPAKAGIDAGGKKSTV